MGTDEEVQRDQRRLEEDVEQEDVSRGKHADRERLQNEHPRKVSVSTAWVWQIIAPRSEHDNGCQDRREQNQHQPSAVDAERIPSSDEGDPLVLLNELNSTRVDIKRSDHRERHCQR